jgi:hypothetical protein
MCAHASTDESDDIRKDFFYEKRDTVCRRSLAHDTRIIIGDITRYFSQVLEDGVRTVDPTIME